MLVQSFHFFSANFGGGGGVTGFSKIDELWLLHLF
jgi:hypothetical protein